VESGDTAPSDLGELDASEFGLQVHAMLAGNLLENPDPAALALADRFNVSALGRQATKAAKVYREFDFLMEVHSVVLRGQIDLWFEHKGKIVLVDYKTDKVTLPVEPVRLEAYAMQLRLYALAIQKMTGKLPESAWLYFLRPDAPVEISLLPLELEAARSAVLDLRDAQNTGSFPLHQGIQCKRCDFYKGLCPAGRGTGEGPTFGTFLRPSSSAMQA